MPTIVNAPKPLQSEAFSRWTVSLVRNALDAHEQGDFSESARLLDAFGRDERIGSAIRTRTNAFSARSGLPFVVEPSESDKRRGKRHANLVEAQWWNAHGEATLARALRDGEGLGAALGWVSWRTEGALWWPRLTMLPATALHFDEQTKLPKFRTESGDIDITPGDGQWFLWTPGGELDPQMHGFVRALGIPYLMRGFGWRDWARWSERHGIPTILLKTPTGLQESEAFLTSVRKLGAELALQLPQPDDLNERGVEAELLEPKAQSHDGFRSLIDNLNVAIDYCLLGQSAQTSTVSIDSAGAARTRDRVRQDFLAGDAERLSTILREQVWKPWGVFNFGEAELAPWGRWDTAPPEDRAEKAKAWVDFGKALEQFGTTGLPIDRAQMAEDFGVALLPGVITPTTGSVRDYHLELGIVTPNEERARLGLAKIEGGDKPIEKQAPPTGGEGEEPPNEENEKPLAASLSQALPRGVRDGQRYVDGVADRARGHARAALEPDVAALLAAIRGATSLEDMRARISVAYAGMPHERLSKLVERATILSRLAGRAAVLEDL